MFRFKRSILALFVVVFIAFTWLIAYLSAPEWTEVFWYKMCGIWIAEALLGATIIMIGNKNAGRTLPFHTGNMTVAALHLCCALVMLAFSCSAVCMLLCEIGLLIVALLCHALFAFAQQAVHDDDIAVKKAFCLRNELLTGLEMLEVSRREMIGADPALAKELEKLKDAARFASDSVPGCEAADEDLRAGLAALKQCADAAELTKAAAELTARIEVRQNVVKRLR